MLKTESELYEKITKLGTEVSSNKNFGEQLLAIYETYNIPMTVSKKILSGNCYPGEYENFVLFALLNALDNDNVGVYFSKKEIEIYTNKKYNVKKFKFPIELKMVECSDDQWIGVISAKELMLWRDAQIINYNENTQRTLKKVSEGGMDIYKISVNKKQIANISTAMMTGTYIPDTITFNMPEDTDFEYDNGILKINSLSVLDILDGYHRYLAISNCYNNDNKFNINLEIRITYYDTDKARQFIWQEDQKVHMEKIESESYNSQSNSNIIVSWLNSNGILTNRIGIKGLVKQGVMSRAINIIFCNSKKMNRSDLIRIGRTIDKKLCELNESWFGKTTWNNEELILLMLYCNGEISEDPSKYIDNQHITEREVTTQTVNRIRKRLEV